MIISTITSINIIIEIKVDIILLVLKVIFSGKIMVQQALVDACFTDIVDGSAGISVCSEFVHETPDKRSQNIHKFFKEIGDNRKILKKIYRKDNDNSRYRIGKYFFDYFFILKQFSHINNCSIKENSVFQLFIFNL